MFHDQKDKIVNLKNRSDEKHQLRSYIGIVPLLLIVLLTVPLYFGGFGNTNVFDPPGLLPTLNLLFLFICPIITGYLTSKSYLRDGSKGLLMLTGGVFAFALGSLMAGFLLPAKGPNAVITIHNIAVFLSGIFHFIGAGLAFSGSQSEQTVQRRKLQLTQLILVILVFLSILTYCVLQNILPMFFIQGQGPTLIRQIILGSATLFFCLSGIIFLNSYRKSRSRFLYWYSISLFLISTGLLLIFFQKSFGSPIGWLGRTAQYIGGIYLIIAIFSGAKESCVGVMRFDKILGNFFRNQLEGLLKERTEQLSLVNEKLYMEVEKLKQTENALRESESEIRELNQELEKKVSQRTAQLERTMRSLESSNKELESFAYIASHDLQEPLRKVQAFSDRLKTKYAAVLDEHGMDYLTRLESSGHRMQTMVNDLLDFSRVKTQGKAFVSINLTDIVKAVMTDLEIQIKETGASVKIKDLPIIEADPHQIQQLFLNLISNALKFHSKNAVPSVKIYKKSDIATSHDSSFFCKIIVEDNGIGFEDQYLDRIFKPFQRLHGRDEYKGTGIGLAICHRIVERHGGAITADSHVGRGTKFIVTLPTKQQGINK